MKPGMLSPGAPISIESVNRPISSKNTETDRIWGMRQGAVDYLVKPVREAVLVAKANEVLGRAEGRRA